ncbi:MAG: type II toxin-antitoxin system HicB family antitoxin [archaeon]|nr:type II toxin-antitoxin system HicB family antitoxin [archaeon]
MDFEIVLEKQKEGGFTVYVPKLPGCISQGETKKEALENIKEAMQLYLDDLNKEELAQIESNVEIIKTSVKINA